MDIFLIIRNIVSQPFRRGIVLFSLILYTSSAALLVFEPCIRGIAYTVHLFVISLFFSYCISLLIEILRLWKSRIFVVLLISIFILNLTIDVVSFCTTKSEFSAEHVALIMGTNIKECQDFLKSYINVSTLFTLLLFYLGLFFIAFASSCIKRFSNVGYILSAFFFLVILFAFAGTNIIKTQSWRVVSLGKIALFFEYKQAPDLSQYRQTPVIEFEDNIDLPDNIVVIIGESHARSHSSLYGYEKRTNPKIDSILTCKADSGLLIKAVSPDITTIKALIKELTTFSKDNEGKIDWKNCISIFDIARQTEYNSVWISNQSQSGIHDNYIARIAELSDSVQWVGVSSGVFKKDYDEIVLPHISHYLKDNTNRNNLIFINLMGSHPSYSERYPQEYNRFQEKDYINYPVSQRKSLAEYDNSLLYNDFIISKIIDRFSTTDMILLYFSDHGQDLFQTDSDYCGHARGSDPKSFEAGREIPAIVLWKGKKSSSVMENMKEVVLSLDGGCFDAENIVYLISSFMGIKSVNGIDVKKSITSGITD